MSADPKTMACYARMSDAYAELITRTEADADLQAFMDALPQSDAPVLDWGCGPGNSAALMQAQGIQAEATDASPEMADLARGLGIEVTVAPYDALDPAPRYRGIWANFALLHLPRDEIPAMIALAARALLPGGVLHLGMKAGEGSARDALGRFFTFVTEDELDRWTASAGLDRLAVRHGAGNGLAGQVEPFVIHRSGKPDA